MSEIKISVVIPCYNVELYLARCLDSVLNQSIKVYEIICVNDCSPDDSVKLILDYQSKYPDVVKLINNEVNMGLGATRDVGLRVANGDYIVFVDSDDYLSKDYIETYIDVVNEDTDLDVVVGGYIFEKGDDKKYYPQNKDQRLAWLHPSAWGKMFRREFLVNNGVDFRGTRLYEDEPFTYRVMMKSPKVKQIGYCGYHYVNNPNSLTQTTSNRSERFFKYIDMLNNLVKEIDTAGLNKDDYIIYEFGIVSGLVASAFFNGQGSGKETMNEIYKTTFHFLKKNFPRFMKNPYFKLFRLPKVEKKKRYCTWLVIFLRRFKMDKMLFGIVGRL